MKVKKRKKDKGKGFLESLAYLKASKNYIYAMVLIFLAGSMIGFVFFEQFGFLDEILRELISRIEGLGMFGIIGFILQNNAKSAFFGLFLGIFLGIFPIFTAVTNGAILGYVMRGVWIDSGIREMWRILPHGIFELPAILISLGLGLKLGMFVFSKNKKEEFLSRIKNSFLVFIFIILPLLVVAAFIEGILIFLYK